MNGGKNSKFLELAGSRNIRKLDDIHPAVLRSSKRSQAKFRYV
jgi:poly-D-alanine transfer protein DltD